MHLRVIVAIAYGALRGHWAEAILAGVTLAMAILPEEFPVVLTVFLALGAWRISKHNVLTRRMPAIETLGATTVLCVDKTGTLTENRMQVAVLETPDVRVDLRGHGSRYARRFLAAATCYRRCRERARPIRSDGVGDSDGSAFASAARDGGIRRDDARARIRPVG